MAYTSFAMLAGRVIDADALRVFVYDVLVESGRPPTSQVIAARFGVSASHARAALRGLRIGKTILPNPETGEIWMAGPFAAAPTAYKVVGRRTTWWANCAWDMLGIPAIVGESVDIEASCTDCGLPAPVRVDADSGPGAASAEIVHFLVPAHRWYEDIGFT